MNGERSLEVLAAEVLERRSGERTAREDDVVDRTATVLRRKRGAEALDDPLDGVAMGEIGGHERDAAPSAIERSAHLFELVRIARRQDDVVASVHEAFGDGHPEPAGRSDDENSPGFPGRGDGAHGTGI
jgi:hypothetical protein